jgi:3-phosphoshikimate 1-carboxyvinyltransferase
MTAQTLTSRPGGALRGTIRAPGDKSISHRALILGALASGETTIEGLLEGADVLATARAMQAFGAEVAQVGSGRWRVKGKGGFDEPADVLDFGNSGTGARLAMGAAAGFPIAATFTGDVSLRRRPMGRITAPLGQMGARHLSREGGRLPLTLHGGGLKHVRYVTPVASAQIKSAVLLAGLNAEGGVEVVEREATRDHTERMLAAFGAELEVGDGAEGRLIRLPGGQALKGTAIRVPGDPSSAAFPLVAALITPDSQVTVEGVLLNGLRIGLFKTLREMGADLTIHDVRDEGGEPVGDVTARTSEMKGVEVPPERAPSMIDEYPILAVAAAFARGRTVMRGLAELRVKESDRIALAVAGLEACGVMVEEEPEGMIVTGTGRANHPVRGGAQVETHGDHRVAMAHLVMGLAAQAPISVDEPEMIATSFPGFAELMTQLGADVGPAASRRG